MHFLIYLSARSSVSAIPPSLLINFETFRKSIKDNDEQLKIHKLTEIKKLTYEIVLKTGKNREIRRIFDVNNIPIKNLKRIQVDKFRIGKMKIGQLKKIKLT